MTEAQKKPRKPAKAKIVMYEPTDDVKKFLEECVGVVEATNFEKMCLWQKYHDKHGAEYPKYWFDERGGPGAHVGTFGTYPVVIMLTKAKVDGHWVAFIEDTSQVVNHTMIEDWLRKALTDKAKHGDKLQYVNKQDAMNFHNVFPRKPYVPEIKKEEVANAG
jgi:hypothetical protein